MIGVGLGVILFWLGYCISYCLTAGFGDYYAHSQFAESLIELKTKPLQVFLNESPYPHIISYPMWHITYLLVNTIGKNFLVLLGNENIVESFFASASTTAFFLVLSFVANLKYLNHYMEERRGKFGVVFLFAFSILFAGPLYAPNINSSYYLGQGTLTAWHNPTSIAVKFIGIICFFLFCKMVVVRKGIKEAVLLSLFLVFSAFFKPSFYQMFVPGMAIFCLWELLETKGKSIGFGIKAGVVVLPVCILALIQMSMSFTGAAEGISFELFKVSGAFTGHPWISTILLLAFPIYILLFSLVTRYKSIPMRIAWCALLSAWIQYNALLIEGDAWWKGDFAWGYYLAAELTFLASLIVLWNLGKEKKYRIPVIIGWGIYFLHVFYGLTFYLNLLFTDNSYLDKIDMSIWWTRWW